MLTVDNISFSYGRKNVLPCLSFSLSAGEVAVLAGPNGSGKSTALSVLSGAIKSSAGSVRVNGKIGYVPQGTSLLEDATVEENLRFFASVMHGEVITERLPFSVNEYRKQRVSKLSGGMKKQVSIACALLGDPDIILLDEPCSALDITFRDEMSELIESWKTAGKAVVYAGHDPMEFYSFFDKIIFLDKPPVYFDRCGLNEQLKSAEEFIGFYKNTLKKIKGE